MNRAYHFILGLLTLLTVISNNSAAQTFAWAGSFGGASTEGSRSTAVDADGNVYTTGGFVGVVDFDPGTGTFYLSSPGFSDIFISKLDALGNFVWAKQVGGMNDDTPYEIAADASGNIYITGLFNDVVDFDPGAGTYSLTSFGFYDGFVSKFDSSGNLIWARQFGGASLDWGLSVTVDANGNVYSTGSFLGAGDFDPGPGTFILTPLAPNDTYISKLDSAGNFIWAKQLEAELGMDITLDNYGNMYVTGDFNGTNDFDPGSGTYNLTSAGDYDSWVAKYDVSGNIIWAKGMGGTGRDWGYSVSVDQDGNVISTGYFNDTGDFDPDTGIFNMTSAGFEDIFISKLDSNGNFLWAREFGGASSDYGYSIAAGNDGNIFTTGYFINAVDFDPGIGTSILTSAGGSDIFISELDASGNYVWAGNIGSSGYDIGYSIVLDASEDIYVAGSFVGTADFDPGVDTFNLTNAGFGDAFVLKLLNQTTGFSNSFKESVVPIIYPNPSTNGRFTIISSEIIDEITIFDMLGQAVQEINPAGKNVTLQIEKEGVYFVKMNSETHNVSKRVMVVD